MTYRENYERWLSSDKVDEATKAELRAIADNDEEIRFRFVKDLEFGTGGLRGTMMAGTNAMNVYTVAHARNNSRLFAETAARVLAANGIKVHLFPEIEPTPVLSFAVRELHCIAGINITASHNPKQYNGYKAYWDDGAQLPPDHAKTVSEFIAAADIFDDVKMITLDDGIKSGLMRSR